MKNAIYIVFVCLFLSTGLASYTYEIYVYSLENIHLFNGESIFVDQQGGMDYLFLNDSSFAMVQGTSVLEQGVGGIGHIELFGSGFLEMSEGEVGTIAINSNATASFTGGLIYQIQSYQNIPDPHIKLYYSGDLPTYNETTDILTGLWGNGDPFSIYLHDISGYAPVINNIEFILIPEPITLALLFFGGLMLRSRKR